MRKRTIIKMLMACGFLLSPMATMTTRAADNNTAAGITINVSGTIYEFYLSDNPVITFHDNVLVVKSDKADAISVDAKDVGAFTFSPSIPTDINQVPQNPSLAFGSKVKGLSPGSRVVVVTIDGKVVLSQVADENGDAMVDFNSLPAGVLVLKTEKGAIKIMN